MKSILLVLLLHIIYVTEISAKPNKVVCYYGSWAVYRNGNGKFDVEDIDVNKCTHVIFAFVGLNDDGSIKILDSWNEVDLGALKRFNSLKEKNKNLKTLVAIGGWNEGSPTFSRVAANDNLLRNFAADAIKFMQTYGFDGFDLDWEYPGQRPGSSGADKQNFVKLLQRFRQQFDASGRKYLLTAAVGASATTIDISYDVPALSKYLDFIHLMAYDFYQAGTTSQNAGLYASSVDRTPEQRERNVASAVNIWIQRGAAPQKLILGMGVYGRSFTLSNSGNHGLGAPSSGPGNKGPYTGEPGMLGYNEICELQKQGGWTEVWDNEQKVPYIYKENQWVGYDNAKSIKLKVEFAKSMNLGGVMIWSIETDDFRGICGSKYPILTAINTALRKA